MRLTQSLTEVELEARYKAACQERLDVTLVQSGLGKASARTSAEQNAVVIERELELCSVRGCWAQRCPWSSNGRFDDVGDSMKRGDWAMVAAERFVMYLAVRS